MCSQEPRAHSPLRSCLGLWLLPRKSRSQLSSFCPALCCQSKNNQMSWAPFTQTPLIGWKTTLGATGWLFLALISLYKQVPRCRFKIKTRTRATILTKYQTHYSKDVVPREVGHYPILTSRALIQGFFLEGEASHKLNIPQAFWRGLTLLGSEHGKCKCKDTIEKNEDFTVRNKRRLVALWEQEGEQ